MNQLSRTANKVLRQLTFTIPLVLIAVICLAQAKKPLTNDDVVQMVKAGFDEPTVIKAIEGNECEFDKSASALISPKNSGVSQTLITAMLTTGKTTRSPKTDPPSVTTPGLPEEIGVYLKTPEKLVQLEPEIVNWRTGGIMKKALTYGIAKAHVKGWVKNAHSPQKVDLPGEFVIRCPEGVSANEYQLVLMDGKKDRREFETVSIGFANMKGGTDKNAIATTFEKIAPRVYLAKVNSLKAGEYGWLPPGAALSANAASLGKIYSFHLKE